jgi:hypothetical protein
MNFNEYSKDPRYWAVWQKMQLLDIRDVSTDRQDNNGTIVWRLPIKNHDNRNPSYIEVASFSTGYVRNQNSGYSNYQLNKRCEGEPEFFDSGRLDELGRPMYTKFTTRSCVLIPIEIDRLEYLISYCLKNYYIKRANEVVEGKYVSKWHHDYMLENANSPTVTRNLKKIGELHDKLEKVKRECNQAYDCGLSDGKTKANETYSENTGAMARISELEDRIYELESQVDVADTRVTNLKLQNEVLQNKLSNAISPTKHQCVANKLYDLQNKLATINRISE